MDWWHGSGSCHVPIQTPESFSRLRKNPKGLEDELRYPPGRHVVRRVRPVFVVYSRPASPVEQRDGRAVLDTHELRGHLAGHLQPRRRVDRHYTDLHSTKYLAQLVPEHGIVVPEQLEWLRDDRSFRLRQLRVRSPVGYGRVEWGPTWTRTYCRSIAPGTEPTRNRCGIPGQIARCRTPVFFLHACLLEA